MPDFVHGAYAEFAIDPLGGTSYTEDMTAFLSEASPEQEIDTAEVTVFGDGTKKYIPGLEDATFSLSGFFTVEADELMNSLKRTLVSFRYRPAGTGTGKPEYTGKGFLSSYNLESTVDEALTIEGEFQVSGGLQRAVQS